MRIRSRFLTRWIARFAVMFLRLLYATCRRRVVTETPGTNPYDRIESQCYLYGVWHDHIVATLFTGKPLHAAALVSRHQDGGYVAETLKLRGIEPVRGSSNRGGAQALRELLSRTERLHVTITPDGPRGPRREIKSGIIFLASQSGRKIVPTSYACKRFWRVRGNWTDMLIPKPFTTVYAICGRPISIPPNLDKQGIRHWTQTVQEEMERAERLIAGVVEGKSLDEMLALETERSVESERRAA